MQLLYLFFAALRAASSADLVFINHIHLKRLEDEASLSSVGSVPAHGKIFSFFILLYILYKVKLGDFAK